MRHASAFHDEKEMVMSVRGMLDLLTRAELVKSEEDRITLFKIIERYLDPDSTYTGIRFDCLVRRPVLLGQEDSLEIGSDIELSVNIGTTNSMGAAMNSEGSLSLMEGTLSESPDDVPSESELDHDDDEDHKSIGGGASIEGRLEMGAEEEQESDEKIMVEEVDEDSI